MKADFVTMTPAKAKELLAKNTHNRPANKKHVNGLAKDMLAGRWKPNGDTIRVGNGRLIDGQHRLIACVQSGVSFETLLVTGIENDVFDTIDTGKRRGGADTLAVHGRKNYTLLAAAVVIVELYYSGRAGLRLTYGGGATNADYLEWVKKYVGLVDSVEHCSTRTTRLVQPSIMSACHYIFSKIDPALADDFIERLSTGENVTKDSPMSKLRERLLQNYTSLKKMDRAHIFTMIVRAWNHERSGKNLKRLRAVYSVDSTEERMPTAV